MKKTAIVLAIVAAGYASITQAAPKDDTWYVGAKVGWSSYHYTGPDSRLMVTNGHTHEHQVGAGGYVGYQANQYLGFELGYDWLGRMPYLTSEGVNGQNTGAFKSHGLQLTAKISYPLTRDLDIYTRLGGMVWRADGRWHIRDGSGNTVNTSGHDTGIAPLTAVGLEYALTRSIATRLDYQWVYRIGDKDTVGARPDNGMLSLGVSYRFGQSEPQPVVAPVVQPTVQTRSFTLRSDVLFSFNKATLKPEGRDALNQMTNELRNLDPQSGSVVVKGYTDRIGSEKYNLDLSRRRAQSVVDYLVSQGFPSNKISATGLGKSNPVTGDTCNNVSPRRALIECLAPDRRVEIEVSGTAETVQQ